ncbi:MAG: DNA-3-methyladenine glycosylase I [Leucobacter sp.]
MNLVDDTLIRAGWASSDPLLTEYYDREWGMPVTDEAGVFERLTLEGFQAGLSWLLVLRRREGFRVAFEGFDPDRVASYGEADIERIVTDPAVIRNRKKIEATVSNARAAVRLREVSGRSLADLVWSYMPETSPTPSTDAEVPKASPESHALAKELKRLGFSFVGPVTVYALMCAIGVVDAHLVGSHRRGCSGLWELDGTRMPSSRVEQQRAA